MAVLYSTENSLESVSTNHFSIGRLGYKKNYYDCHGRLDLVGKSNVNGSGILIFVSVHDYYLFDFSILAKVGVGLDLFVSQIAWNTNTIDHFSVENAKV